MLFKDYDDYLLTALKDPENAEEYWQRQLKNEANRVTDPSIWFKTTSHDEKVRYATNGIENTKINAATKIAEAHGLFNEKFRVWCFWNNYGILVTDVSIAYAYTFSYTSSVKNGNTVYVPELQECNRVGVSLGGITIYGKQHINILQAASKQILERFQWLPEIPKQSEEKPPVEDLKCDCPAK